MNAAMVMGARGFENGFIPDSEDVLWHTKLLDHGKEELLEFTAPAAGEYPYILLIPWARYHHAWCAGGEVARHLRGRP